MTCVKNQGRRAVSVCRIFEKFLGGILPERGPERYRRSVWCEFIPNHSVRKLRSITMYDVMAFMAHVDQVVKRQRNVRIINVVWCKMYLVMDDFSQLFAATFTDSAVNGLPVLYVCFPAFLPSG